MVTLTVIYHLTVYSGEIVALPSSESPTVPQWTNIDYPSDPCSSLPTPQWPHFETPPTGTFLSSLPFPAYLPVIPIPALPDLPIFLRTSSPHALQLEQQQQQYDDDNDDEESHIDATIEDDVLPFPPEKVG